jgi:hypothetical protein
MFGVGSTTVLSLLFVLFSVRADDPTSHHTPSMLPNVDKYITRHSPSPSVIENDTPQEHVVVIRLKSDALDDVYLSDRVEERFSAPGVSRMESKMRGVAQGHGFHYLRPIAGLPGYHLFTRDLSMRNVEHGMNESADVEWFEDVAMPPHRIKRGPVHSDLGINDPLWSSMWYMANVEQLSYGTGQLRPGQAP